MSLDLGEGVELQLTRIEAGEFDMGTPPIENERPEKAREESRPVRHVRITKPFYLGTYEVTRKQFARFVDETGYKTGVETSMYGANGWNGSDLVLDKKYNWRTPSFEQTDSHPVVNVVWDDAQAFCAWATKRTGHQVRLPTEAEWEYCYRAGTTTPYFWGDDRNAGQGFANMPDLAFQRGLGVLKGAPLVTFDDGYVFTAPVGSFKPNPWGLYDMQGNVWEVTDDWNSHYVDAPPNEDPRNPPHRIAGGARSVRGGSYGDEILNPFMRGPVDASRRGMALSFLDSGFRVVVSMPAK